MRNYRRLSGDGSVKVVLSGDSNSPPKTTPRREPPSCNSSPTQEVCPSVACPSRVRVPTPSRCHTLPSFPTTDHEQLPTGKSTSVDFQDLLKFQKKPVFALIRGLFSSAGEFPNVDFCPSESLCLRASVVKLSQPQNVDSGTSHQNPSKKARNVAYCRITEEISKTVFAALSPFHQNVDCALPTASLFAPLPPVPNPQALLPPQNIDKQSLHPRRSAIIEKYRLSFPRPKKRVPASAFLLPHGGRLYLQKINSSSCFLCELSVFVVKWDLPSVQNPFKKARESAIIHLSTFAPSGPKPSAVSPQKSNSTFHAPRLPALILHSQISILHFLASHQNSQKTPVNPLIPPNPTCSSHRKVDFLPWDLAFGTSSSWALGDCPADSPFRFRMALFKVQKKTAHCWTVGSQDVEHMLSDSNRRGPYLVIRQSRLPPAWKSSNWKNGRMFNQEKKKPPIAGGGGQDARHMLSISGTKAVYQYIRQSPFTPASNVGTFNFFSESHEDCGPGLTWSVRANRIWPLRDGEQEGNCYAAIIPVFRA
jgi:hypothetical protein